MTRTLKKIFAVTLFIFTAGIENAFSSRTLFNGLSSYISLDMPEGFKVVESGDNGKYYMLESTVAPVKAIERIYAPDRFTSTQEALATVMESFSLNYEKDNFTWRTREASVSTFDGIMLGENSFGYALALKLEEGNILVSICWTDEKNSGNCNSFIVSFLDSVFVDSESYFESGPFTQYVFPEGEKDELTLNIQDKQISTLLGKNDVEAAEYLIQRENEVLSYYRNSHLWQLAWIRYYRMIFRDSCKRLQNVSFDVYNAFAPECSDETDYATRLLNWTQTFSYERETTSADFTSLPGILKGKGSDCDSRAMLLAVMLQSMNIDSIIFVSTVHSHGIAGLASTHPGYAFTVGEKDYLVGETTIPGLTWGIMDASQSDPSIWIPVTLP